MLGFGSVIALLFLTGVLGTAMLRTAHHNLQQQTLQVIAVKNQLFASQEATRQYVVLAQNDLLRSGASTAVASMDSVSAVADSLRLQLNLGDAMTDAERVSLAKIGAIQGRIGTRLAIARAWMDVGNPEAATQHTAASSLLLDSLFAISSAIIAAEDARATGMLGKADRVVTRQQWLVQSLLAVGLLAALVVGFATLRAVTKPLDMLATGARRVGDGNLKVAIDPTGLDEEYRVVAQALADTTRSALAARARDPERGARRGQRGRCAHRRLWCGRRIHQPGEREHAPHRQRGAGAARRGRDDALRAGARPRGVERARVDGGGRGRTRRRGPSAHRRRAASASARRSTRSRAPATSSAPRS